jgi:hypothetical protein
VNDLFYSEHETSLRRFLVSELIKQSGNVEVTRDVAEPTQLAIDPSAHIGDVLLARRFSKK